MNDQPNNPFPSLIEGAVRLTMSSREIAELIGKQHDNVLRDTRNMLESLEKGLALKFEGYYVAANGKKNPCFNLPKRETLILVSGYDVVLRTKIIDSLRRPHDLQRQDQRKHHERRLAIRLHHQRVAALKPSVKRPEPLGPGLRLDAEVAAE